MFLGAGTTEEDRTTVSNRKVRVEEEAVIGPVEENDDKSRLLDGAAR